METKIKKIIFKRLIKKIEQDNQTFKNATPAEKRIIVAQDCIQRINANQILPRGSGSVFVDDTKFDDCDAESSLQTVLNTCDKDSIIQCEACGKGGLFLSYVGRANEFETKNLNYGNEVTDAHHVKLLELFSLEQLSLIEAAFEGTQMIGDGSNDVYVDLDAYADDIDDYNKSFSKYIDKYPDDKKRLIAICKNIIENKGEFVY